MLYLKSLSAITSNELQAVGQRATDIALLAQNRVGMPHAFVVLSTAYDELVRVNNLKYKVDYILSHAQESIQSSLVNAYNGVRKAMLEATFQNGLETELKSLYESITMPIAVGDLVAANDRVPVRIIMSMNMMGDSENNDTIIQNIGSFEELLVGVREAWSLAYHPSQLGGRMHEKFPENRLKIALIVQVMDRSIGTCHAYSCLPQDHHKIYLQIYPGYPDLREKLAKDYYAVSKDGLRVVTSQLQKQHSKLDINEAKELAIMPQADFELIDRDVVELARLTKKAEQLMQTPVKCFFSVNEDNMELLWVNRMPFNILIKDEQIPEPVPRVHSHEPRIQPIVPVPKEDDFLMPSTDVGTQNLIDQVKPAQVDVQHGVAAKLLRASMRIVRQIIDRKYRNTFGETTSDNLADQINRMNERNVFSRTVDGALLLQAEHASNSDGRISDAEYARTIEEVAYLMTYA